MLDNSHTLKRQVLSTSRWLEFTSIKELELQTGHPVDEWLYVVGKELVDNALDACEAKLVELGAAPSIDSDERCDHE
jgi:hypothetical protein